MGVCVDVSMVLLCSVGKHQKECGNRNREEEKGEKQQGKQVHPCSSCPWDEMDSHYRYIVLLKRPLNSIGYICELIKNTPRGRSSLRLVVAVVEVMTCPQVVLKLLVHFTFTPAIKKNKKSASVLCFFS
jgi:hypothetical protein